jgi:uncharacterized membrane protein YbaN (DUF454 family)
MASINRTADTSDSGEIEENSPPNGAFNPFSTHAQNTMVRFEIEKSALLFWGWIGFGIAILSFHFPIMPGLSFLGIAIWAILQSSPHLGSRIAAHPKIEPHLQQWLQTRDMPKNFKIAVTICLGLGAAFVAFQEGRLALVAFGLFICLPIASALWGKPFRHTPHTGE